MSDLLTRLQGLMRDKASADRVREAAESLPDMTADEAHVDDLRNELEAARDWAPQSSYSEELLMRLVGSLPEGGLPVALGEKLLRPLQDALSDLADHSIPLMLVAVSHGSTVLHLQPVDQAVETVDEVPVDTSPTDAAVREALTLFRAIEDRGDLGPWARSFTSLSRFLAALEEAHVTAGFIWRSHAGEIRSAALSEEGLGYFRDRTGTTLNPSEMLVNGRVTELREAGVVKVKTGAHRNSPAYVVHFDDPTELIHMHLGLGDPVNWATVNEEHQDDYGVTRASRIRFLHVAPPDMTLPVSE